MEGVRFISQKCSLSQKPFDREAQNLEMIIAKTSLQFAGAVASTGIYATCFGMLGLLVAIAQKSTHGPVHPMAIRTLGAIAQSGVMMFASGRIMQILLYASLAEMERKSWERCSNRGLSSY